MNRIRRRLPALLLGAALAAGCTDAANITAPDLSRAASSRARERVPASVRWNRLARQLIAVDRIDPPMASRTYALLGVAQHEALRATSGPALAGRGHALRAARPSELAAVAAASAAVLRRAHPGEATAIDDSLQTALRRLIDAGESEAEVEAGRAIGIATGDEIASRDDGAQLPWGGSVPTGDGIWFSSIGTPPLRPEWSRVRPWLMRSPDQFRPAPPPAFGSAEYLAALGEVRRISEARTPEQLRIALFWADGVGTATPPGHWNAIADDLIVRYALDERRAAKLLALLNMALMDAGIACWDAKFTYWLIRPSQADPAITTPVGLPNFPSYTSGHATFSGAASEVLAHAFPAEARHLRAMAEEAAMSRLYGGIHYRFDNEGGLAAGRAIGALAIRRGESED